LVKVASKLHEAAILFQGDMLSNVIEGSAVAEVARR